MRKEEIRELIIYTLLILIALIVGFAFIRPTMVEYGPEKMGQLIFLVIVLIIAYLANAIGLELLHLLGALIGGYKVTSFCILGFCFEKKGQKWKIAFREFNGVCGETKIAPNKEKTNVNWLTWFPLFGYAIEFATCVVIMVLVKSTATPKSPWLASAAAITILVSSLIAFYNLVPLKLDTITDGYKIRLFSNPINVEAFNKMLAIEEKRRLGENVEKVPVFSEITEYTAQINKIAMYEFLEEENYEKAQEILDKLLENQKVLSANDYNRLIAQKLYLSVLTQDIQEAKKLYDEICPTEIRRFIANDISMPSIRAYIMIAGMIEESESEVIYAQSKVEKAKKRSLESEIKTEEKLLNKAIDYVYNAHPKWKKEDIA